MKDEKKEHLEKAKSELETLSDDFEKQKQENAEMKLQEKADLIWDFINGSEQLRREFSSVKKMIFRVFSNVTEDYIEMEIYDNSKLLLKANNLIGIELIDRLSPEVIDVFMNYICNQHLALFDLENGTMLEINIG